MKLLTTILLCIILISCETKNTTVNHTDITISGRNLKIYTIDKCEYIGNVYGGQGDFLTHKGNCNNPIHKYENN